MKIMKDERTNRNKVFEALVSLKQEEIKTYLKRYLAVKMKRFGKETKDKIISNDGYLYYSGEFPVLLCAHMDTVHKKLPSTIVYTNGTISSPQGIGGDDRCGIYMILKILEKYDCSVVFLEDEEDGCIGAKKFARSEIARSLEKEGKLKYIMEFDRKGNNHAVFYDCNNPDFTKFITQSFFKEEIGTCSDISYIAPAIGVAAVNLSCGYYHEHYLDHYVVLDEMEKVVDEALRLLEDTNVIKRFEYIKKAKYGYGSSYYGRYYDDYDDYYYSGNHYNGYSSYKQNKYYFKFLRKALDNSKFITEIYINGNSVEECFYKFFKNYPSVCYDDVLAHGWSEDYKKYY